MKYPLMVAGLCLSIATMATYAKPIFAATSTGGGSCYYNDMGGACSDLNGNGYWSECESGFGSGTKSESWASGHCGGGWHSG